MKFPIFQQNFHFLFREIVKLKIFEKNEISLFVAKHTERVVPENLKINFAKSKIILFDYPS
jgi:hypothetical protein